MCALILLKNKSRVIEFQRETPLFIDLMGRGGAGARLARREGAQYDRTLHLTENGVIE